MIHIIITSFNEPKSTLRAVQAFLSQDIKEKFQIIVVDPFPEVKEFLKKEIKDSRVGFFLDPGEGKSYALNLLFEKLYSKNTNDIIILTDGDVYVSQSTVQEILNIFKDKEIGCVTGHPISLDSKDTKYGFWAHVAFSGIDKTRKRLSRQNKFMEATGYLFGIRNGVIKEFPLETSEDSIIPYLFWKKGYRIAYADKAEVYVKNPSSWKDWLAQKVRNVKAHENLSKIAPDLPRTKSLFNEIKEGAFYALMLPRSLKQFFWLLELYFARLYMYLKAFKDLRWKRTYADGWRGDAITETTKTLD